MNILLNDTERELYKDSILELYTLCPDTIKRKISRANVQQAWMLNTLKKHVFEDANILCVGSFEDTACEALQKLGFKVNAIDPAINTSLHDFFVNCNEKFDIIFSTSVIEHVQDDELFIDEICKLLKNGGYGFLTCDFNNTYKDGHRKPSEDARLYTKYDLLERLNGILIKNDCNLFGDINYDATPDFIYSGHLYSFATYSFKKFHG